MLTRIDQLTAKIDGLTVVIERLLAPYEERYLAGITGETAARASKTQTREGARYRRLTRRRGKAKAQVALGNTQLKVYHKLLSSPGMRWTSAPTTTTATPALVGRSPTTSASSAPSASRSLSAASPALTLTPANQQTPRPPDPYRAHRP